MLPNIKSDDNYYQTKSSVLFIVFCSLDTTKETFSQIRRVRPKKLYVGCDGHRSNVKGEEEKINAVRKFILSNVDWNCEVKTRFIEKNEGTKFAIFNAIKWFFQNEETGIILEHDCVPNVSFFRFCDENLDKYKYQENIMWISGMAFLKNINLKESYFFSNYAHCWGWATWKRAIDLYELDESNFKEVFNNFSYRFNNKREIKYWLEVFSRYYDGMVQTWDYPLLFSFWKNNGLGIYPKVSMVKQIGFGHPDAVHTKSKDNRISTMKIVDMTEIIHPKEIEINRRLSLMAFNRGFACKSSIITRALVKIKRLLKEFRGKVSDCFVFSQAINK